MYILVIDAQGGGIGKQLITAIKKELPDSYIMAVGTNVTATAAMRKAGASHAATGENAVMVACRKADVIVGPIGIVIADSMFGEITPAMALAISQAQTRRILIPFRNCDNVIPGVSEFSVGELIEKAVAELVEGFRYNSAAEPDGAR